MSDRLLYQAAAIFERIKLGEFEELNMKLASQLYSRLAAHEDKQPEALSGVLCSVSWAVQP